MIYSNKVQLEKSIANICRHEYIFFLNKKSVQGIGCGYKVTNGFCTDKLCIQILVSNKISNSLLAKSDLVPNYYKNILTDVIEVGEITTCSLTYRKRPVVGGFGISIAKQHTYGTTGCLVTNGVSNFLLTTNHTFTDEGRAAIGTSITEPAYFFGGKNPADTIATLNKFIPLRPIEEEKQPVNLTDCALGLLTERNIVSPKINFIGNLKGVKRPKLNDPVKKVGAATELTFGTVTEIHASIIVRLPSSKRYLFKDLIITTSMLGLGDSGAILVNKYDYGLGLGFAGTSTMGIYCPLDTVLDQLDVKLVT